MTAAALTGAALATATAMRPRASPQAHGSCSASASPAYPRARASRSRSSRTTSAPCSPCWRCWPSPRSPPAARASPAAATARCCAGEALLAGTIAINVLIVGAGVGAYGDRMARALLPHGPVELGAFAAALALYLQGRRQRLPLRHILTVTVPCLGLLAVAAALETFG